MSCFDFTGTSPRYGWENGKYIYFLSFLVLLLWPHDDLMFLTRFTETETYMEVFSLHVDVMEPDCSIIKLGPKSLEVPEFYGFSDAVDGNVVSFRYEKKSSLECSIHLSSHDTHLPGHGQLVTGEPEKATKRGDEPESFIPLRQQLGNL